MVTIDRTALTAFGVSVHWYGVCIVTGMVLAVLLACAREKRYGLPKDTALDLALCGIPAAIVGARLYYVAFSWPEYANGPIWRIFAVWEGGLAVYGGLIFGILAGLIYGCVKKLSFGKLLALAAPGMALGQALGRWGNFFNQEAYGVAITNPRLCFFPIGVPIEGVWHCATFFYESAWCLGIVLFLLWCEKKNKCAKEVDVFLLYVFLYAMERTVVEGLRTDSLFFGPLRVSQALSALGAAVVIGVLALRRENRNAGLALCALSLLAVLAAMALHSELFVFAACAAALVFFMYGYFKRNTSRKDGTRCVISQ